MQPAIPDFLQSWSLELGARANRVRQLIGDAHWLSDGHHKEELLRQFLVNYLPRDVLVSRGFVKTTTDLHACSPEVDILITDPSINPPIFLEGGLQIVDVTCVLAVVEVKTALSSAKIKQALTSLGRTTSLIRGAGPAGIAPYSLLHFYTADQPAASAVALLSSCLTEVRTAGRAEGWYRIGCFPTAITAMDRFVAFLSSAADGSIDVRLFEATNLSLACAIADLLGHVRQVRGGAALGGLDNLLESIAIPTPERFRLDP